MKETNKLWLEATRGNETFDFKTIDEVLEENQLCKEENKRLNDIIEEDIKELNEKVAHNEEKIENATKVLTNEIANVSSTVVQNTDEICRVDQELNEKVGHNEDKINRVDSSVVLLSHDVEILTDDVDTIAEDLSSEIANVSNVLRDVSSTVYQNTDKISGLDQDLITLTSSVQSQESQVEENTQRLDTISDEVSTLSIHGAWCGYQDEWRYKSIITYDTIKFKETNMDITGTPLDILSGKYNVI